MTVSRDMNTYAGRLASFDSPKQVNKRRASSQKKKQPTTTSWPLDSPTPEQLAKAGFFYKPSSSSPDSVTCFLCNKALDGWDANDNPANEHLSHVPGCGWAINCCIEQRIENEDRVEENPFDEKMVESRLATYSDWWPHETKKGWKCKTKKMVDAGWCYTPIPEADDCVTCFYCGASLEGWEPKDDPWQEHRKRAPDCHFFTLVEESYQIKRATKAKTAGTSRTSRTSRQSVQSTTSAGVDDSAVQLDNEPAIEEGDSLLSTATTTSKAGKGRKKASKPGAGKPRSKKGVQSVTNEDDEPINANQIEAELERELGMPQSDEEGTEEAPKQTRVSKQRTASSQTAAEESKSKARQGRKGAAKPPPAAPEVEQDDNTEVEDSMATSKQPQRPTRGRKRMSDGSEKAERTHIVVLSSPQQAPQDKDEAPEEPPEHAERPAKKPKRAPQENTEVVEAPSASPPRQQKREVKGKSKKIEVHEDDVEEASQQSIEEVALEAEQQEQQKLSLIGEYEVEGEDEEGSQQLLAEPRQQATPPPADDDSRTFSATPQSSDAENQPPSSRRKPAGPPPMAQTPKTSPSKWNVIGGEQLSKDAWKPIDLEGVFLPSPSYARAAFDFETIMQNLTAAERQMTVEDWIKKNALTAEDRLREECERMIGKFEDEGNRALNTMEGIECA